MKIRVTYTYTCELEVPDILDNENDVKAVEHAIAYLELNDSWPKTKDMKVFEHVQVYRKVTASQSFKALVDKAVDGGKAKVVWTAEKGWL